MGFGIHDLALPVVGAPMAGGPSTPELAAAVSTAGGLGFLAAGYLSADRFAADIATARAATTGPLGVNLFAPGRSLAVADELSRYGVELQPLAEQYGAEVGRPHADDDGWAAKLEVVADLRPEIISFTFACPASDVLARFREMGVLTLVTVTTSAEAQVAVDAGAEGLIVQGPKAGGHRGTFDPGAYPADQPLDDLVDAVVAAGLPVIAAGGLATPGDVAGVLRRGAVAAQVGTALLLADEAGTNAAHRAALTSPEFTETVITRAFSGRYARGLRNAFTARFDAVAPFGYPEVNQMTSQLRKAAVAAGDPHGTNLWAGTAFATAQARPAGDIVSELAGR
jgi:nitronate monooxygenase